MCESGISAGIVWAIVIFGIAILIGYGIISSNRQAAKERALRESALPTSLNGIRVGIAYDVLTKQGNWTHNLKLIGGLHQDDKRTIKLGERTIVFSDRNGSNIFIRESIIRIMKESATDNTSTSK